MAEGDDVVASLRPARGPDDHSGQAQQDAFVESFNARFRDECSKDEVFASMAEARAFIENWRRDYSTFRPHSAHGGLPPA